LPLTDDEARKIEGYARFGLSEPDRKKEAAGGKS
jgi:hypothetical protein